VSGFVKLRDLGEFEIRGDGVTLVGVLPVPAQVGYGEELENLVGKTVTITSHGGNPHEQRNSSLRLAGVPALVSGGTITFRKVTGKWSGQDGDRTVWGTVEIQIETASGTTTLEAVALMKEKGIGSLPVVKDGQLIGIVTERDFMNIASVLLEEKLKE